MQRRLITVTIHKDAIPFLVFTDYFTTHLKHVPSSRIRALSGAHATGQWMR